MNWQTILSAFFLTLVYSAIIAGLAWMLRRAGVAGRWAIALGCVVFGIASGLLAAWAWPYDSCVLPNLWAVLLGDALYQWASAGLANPGMLAVPWVYPLAGAILYGALGLVVQVSVNRFRAGPAAGRERLDLQP